MDGANRGGRVNVIEVRRFSRIKSHLIFYVDGEVADRDTGYGECQQK